VGRLDDIIDRNKNPRKHRKQKFPMGLMVAAFVLLVLVLMIFTDAGMGTTPAPPPPDPTIEKRVDGVKLYRAPNRPDAATTQAP
jgi:hypothetical protein